MDISVPLEQNKTMLNKQNRSLFFAEIPISQFVSVRALGRMCREKLKALKKCGFLE